MTALRSFACLAALITAPSAMALMPVAKQLPVAGAQTASVESEQEFWNHLGLTEESLDNLLIKVSSTPQTLPIFGGPSAAANNNGQPTAPPTLQPDLKILFNEADLQNPADWKSLFDVVVVINKGVSKQHARIYRYGKLEKIVPVSTGREKVELADPNATAEHTLTHDTTSQTYTGFYSPTVLDIDHVSEAYRDSSMPWAVFFNPAEGEATHRSPYEDLSRGIVDHNLGHRASGGCVRMHEGDARDLFWMVRFTGTAFLPRETSNPHFMGEAKSYLARGAKVLDQAPEIPKFDVRGNVQVDPATGKPIMIPGKFKTLYIVLNSDLTDPPVPKKPKVAKPVAAKPGSAKPGSAKATIGRATST
jgi:lipoprotein-anchoring transpeptidase ErfK/SrfK